jgi:hypothetical protein
MPSCQVPQTTRDLRRILAMTCAHPGCVDVAKGDYQGQAASKSELDGHYTRVYLRNIRGPAIAGRGLTIPVPDRPSAALGGAPHWVR